MPEPVKQPEPYSIIPIPEHIEEKYNSWKDAREEWLKRGDKCREFFNNDVEGTKTLYTETQKDNIEDGSNITAGINDIYRVVSQKLSLYVRSKPSHRIISTDGRAKKAAFVLDKSKHSVLYSSKSPIQTEEAIKDSFLYGFGFKMLDSARRYMPGNFGLQSKYLPPKYVILDPNVRDPSFDDEEGWFIDRNFLIEKAKSYYGQYIEGAVTEDGTPVDMGFFSSGNTEVDDNLALGLDPRVVQVREFYDIKESTMYVVQNANGDYVRVFKENMTPAQADELALDQLPDEDKIKDLYYRVHICLGQYLVKVITLQLTYSPLLKYCNEWGGKPYESYGMAHWLIDPSVGKQKMLQMFILNGMLSNNKGYIAPKGSISDEDEEKWEKFGANPRVVKYYDVVTKDGIAFKPEQEKVEPLSNFYPVIMEVFTNGINDVAGIPPILSGDTSEGKIDVFMALERYMTAAMQRVKMGLDRINQAEQEHGNALIELLVANLEPRKNYLAFDDEGNLHEFKIAKNDIGKLRRMRFFVHAIPSEAMPNQKLMVANEFMKIAQTTQDPGQRDLFINQALKFAEIRGADDILEKTDALKNSNQKIQQVMEQLERQVELSKQMENRMVNTETQNKILEMQLQAMTTIARQTGKFEGALAEHKKQTFSNNGAKNE